MQTHPIMLSRVSESWDLSPPWANLTKTDRQQHTGQFTSVQLWRHKKKMEILRKSVSINNFSTPLDRKSHATTEAVGAVGHNSQILVYQSNWGWKQTHSSLPSPLLSVEQFQHLHLFLLLAPFSSHEYGKERDHYQIPPKFNSIISPFLSIIKLHLGKKLCRHI